MTSRTRPSLRTRTHVKGPHTASVRLTVRLRDAADAMRAAASDRLLALMNSATCSPVVSVVTDSPYAFARSDQCSSDTRYGSTVQPVSRRSTPHATRGTGAVQATLIRLFSGSRIGTRPSARMAPADSRPGASRTIDGSTDVR